MGYDDLCNTGLVLGLGFPSSPPAGKFKQADKQHEGFFYPSLTLSLSAGVGCDNYKGGYCRRQDSGASRSSLSNASVKREREMGEEVEIERRPASDEDDDGSNRITRKKLRLTKAQSVLLEESFKRHSTLNPKQKQDLARELKLRPRQVEVWFQNRRARTKLKQTEVDYELLKKCCETLTDENQRLHKELQELKALKLPHPLYMRFPAATLTMCPSCERTASGGGAPENAAKSSYVMAPKPHFYNPFTNQPAAC